MYKFLKKILKFRFSTIIPNGKYLAEDFEIIDKSLSLDIESINSDRQIIKILSDQLNHIAENIHLPIASYAALKNKNVNWMDDFRGFKYAKYLTSHFDQIFKNALDINSLNSFPNNTDDENSFISLKLGARHYFILEIGESRWHNFYVRLFYSQIYQKGFRAKEIQRIKFKVDSPLVKYFTKHNAPVYIKQLERQKEFATYVEKLKELGIFILAPIMYAERVQGILATGEKLYASEFTQTDYELFHVLVNIISISIENSLHYEAVKNLSLTDEMTNLHNYRSFISRLKEEINRSKRNKKSTKENGS
jgi:hypothetical protein